jgi:hypothetical protein
MLRNRRLSSCKHLSLFAARIALIAGIVFLTATAAADNLQADLRQQKRRSGFYVWKVFVPLLIMTMIPAVVFWIDVKEFDWMLKVPMTMLLSMVHSSLWCRGICRKSAM